MPDVKVPAPITGMIGDVKVTAGQAVQKGDVLAVQVQTKTEFQVKATAAGKVKRVAEKGDTLKEGDTVAEIEC